MRTVIILALAAVLVPLAAHQAAVAEKVDTPPAALHKAATNVIVGTVKAVYTRTEKQGRYLVFKHVAEVEVLKDEKGKLAKGTLAYVRYWRQRWQGPGTPPPGTAGHRGVPQPAGARGRSSLPQAGQTLRIHAVSKGYNGFGTTTDGGLDVYGANGFQPYVATSAKRPKAGK